jgi:hypothetical protein
MFEIKKDISFSYQGKLQKFSVGSLISQQELITKLDIENVNWFLKEGYLIETPNIQEQDIQETKYRFEVSGYKPFRKNSQYSEKEIIEAGYDIQELLDKEVITWLK